jgi:O-antigen/teichoic acid export membrane protein
LQGVLPFFIDLVVKDPIDHETVRQLLIILGINILFIFPNYVFSGMVYGFQVYHLKNLIDVALVIINAALVYFLLLRGYGIFALAIIKTFGDLIGLVASYLLSRKVFPGLRVSVTSIGSHRYKEIFSLGGKIFSSSTMVRIAANGEPMIISYALSNAWTAVFSIPKRLIDYVKEISWALTTGFMPMFSELQGKNDTAAIRSIYFQYTRYVVMVVAPILTAVFAYGTPFISLWIGNDFALKGKLLVPLLSTAFFVECLQPLVWRMFIGVDKVNFLVKISSLSSFAYIVLAFSLVWKFGVNGVALGGLIVSCICQTIFFIFTARYLGTTVTHYIRECHLMPIVASMTVLGLMLWLRLYWPPVTYGILLPQVAGSMTVYALLSLLFSLKNNERARIFEFVQARTFLLQDK